MGRGGNEYRVFAGDYAAIAAGGALGASVRHLIALALPVAAGGMPWATLSANLVGSFTLGYLLRADALGRRQMLFAAVGFLGSLTTFSTLAFEITQRANGGEVRLAAAYTAATLIAGLLAAWSGAELARRRTSGARS